jgi:single-stranded-DNA-specific exonuclease
MDAAVATARNAAGSKEPVWRVCAVDREQALALAGELGCPLPVAAVLVQRGYAEPETARRFLAPSLDDLIDPMRMTGMDAAVERIVAALRAHEPILIYGDYDVDGTVATTVLKIALERAAAMLEAARDNVPTSSSPEWQAAAEASGVAAWTASGAAQPVADVRYHVPHRIREGYGMQNKVLAEAHLAGVRLVISVDTGIRAFAAADECRALGLDLIVTDHHLPDEAGVPDAVAVINPAQRGCSYPFDSLCGAAVALKLAQAVLHAAAEANPATAAAAQERLRAVLLPSFLKLVAIATVADSVPLIGENRTIVALGLAGLAKVMQPGLRALFHVAELPPGRSPTVTEVGFRLAPRINAAGRMDMASDVVELFLTRDRQRAGELAEKLDRLNEERKATEAAALRTIEAMLEERLRAADGRQSDTTAHGLTEAGAAAQSRHMVQSGETVQHAAEVLLLDHPEWHRGVLGILASRVVDRTGRPALVMTHEDGQAHGSGRSVDGFHLLQALEAVHEDVPEDAPNELSAMPTARTADPPALFTRFGGHAQAVGFSLPSANLPLLRSRMQAYATPLLAGRSEAPALACDHELDLAAIDEELMAWVERCGPFGFGSAEPVWLCRGVEIAGAVRWLKEKHLSVELRPVGSGWARGMRAVGWSRGPQDWRRVCARLCAAVGAAADSTSIGATAAPQAFAASNGLDVGLPLGLLVDAACRLRRNTFRADSLPTPNSQTPLYGIELELVGLRLATGRSVTGPLQK